MNSNELEKIRLNVGGQKHETYLSTIGNLPDTRLYSIIESTINSPDYDSETSEIFFDRHPDVFAQILNYYRTGKLHCPKDICGPLFEDELQYWGIDEKEMEACCWINYTQYRDAEENLKNVVCDKSSQQFIEDSSRSIENENKCIRCWNHSCSHWWKKIQRNIWSTIDESRLSILSQVFSFASVIFIMVSVAMSCVNTIEEVNKNDNWRKCFDIVERTCGFWFTMEFLLRTIFCPDKGKLFKECSTWIDLVAIIPFYLKFIANNHIDVINALLVVRLLRLFRFFRLVYGLQVLFHTLKSSSYELLLLFLMLLIPVVFFSSVVFFVEYKSFPEDTKFRSIPHSFWWSLITITTVGYGDIYPRTWLGKIVGSMCAMCGVLIVALPVSVIGNNFSLFYAHAQAKLKLPKKKKKLFLQQSSTVYSERHLPRRKALRKKESRLSDTYSAMYSDSRESSTQGNLITNGTKRTSLVGKDQCKLFSSIKKIPRKKTSVMSMKIPTPLDENMEENRELEKELSSVDSSYYVTQGRSLSSPDGLKSFCVGDEICANEENMKDVKTFIRCYETTHEKANKTRSSPEIIALLEESKHLDCGLKNVERTERINYHNKQEITEESTSTRKKISSQFFVNEDGYLNSELANEQIVTDDQNSSEINICTNVLSRDCSVDVVNWEKKRPLSLTEDILETVVAGQHELNYIDNGLVVKTIKLPNDFNPARRQATF